MEAEYRFLRFGDIKRAKFALCLFIGPQSEAGREASKKKRENQIRIIQEAARPPNGADRLLQFLGLIPADFHAAKEYSRRRLQQSISFKYTLTFAQFSGEIKNTEEILDLLMLGVAGDFFSTFFGGERAGGAQSSDSSYLMGKGDEINHAIVDAVDDREEIGNGFVLRPSSPVLPCLQVLVYALSRRFYLVPSIGGFEGLSQCKIPL